MLSAAFIFKRDILDTAQITNKRLKSLSEKEGSEAVCQCAVVSTCARLRDARETGAEHN